MNTKTTLRELADALDGMNQRATKYYTRVVFGSTGSVWIEQKLRYGDEIWHRVQTCADNIVAHIRDELPGYNAWLRYHYHNSSAGPPEDAIYTYAALPKRVRDAWAEEENNQ